jgi:hypothetical protein
MDNKKVVMSLSEILEKKQKLAKSKPIELKAEVKEPVIKSKVIKKDRKKKGVVSVLEAKQEKTNIEKDVTNSALNMNLHKLAKTKETIQPEKPNVITSDNSKIQSDNMKVQLPEVTKPSLSKYNRESDEQIFNKYISQLNNVSGQHRANYLQEIYNMVGYENYNDLVNKKILLDISSQPYSDVEKLKEYVTKSSNDILVISPFDASFVTMLKNIQLDGRNVLCVEESFVVSDYINSLNIPNLTIANKFPLAFIESYSFVRNILNTDLVYANFRYASPQTVLSLLCLIYGLNEYNKSSSKSIILSSLKNYGDKLNIRELLLSVPVHIALSILLGENYDKNLDKKIYDKYYSMLTKTSENVEGAGFSKKEDYPDYKEVIFGGTFNGTALNPNPAVIKTLPDRRIKITSIPLNTAIIYKDHAYFKMSKVSMQKIKDVMMDGKEMKNNYLVLYSDKSITTRTKNKDENQTGSFMEGVGELIKYNTETKKFIIKNQEGQTIEIGKNYFVLCYQVDKQEISQNDITTLDDSTIDPYIEEDNYDYTVESLPPTEQDIEALNNYPVPKPEDVLDNTDDSVKVNPRLQPYVRTVQIPTAPQMAQTESATAELLPTTRPTETTPAAVETTASANPNADIPNDVRAPVVQSEGSSVESIVSSHDNSGASTPASSGSASSSSADAKDIGLLFSPIGNLNEHMVIQPDTLKDALEEEDSSSSSANSSEDTFDSSEMQYLQNLINETNKRFKIQSFKKLFETKRYNNPMLYTYLIEL